VTGWWLPNALEAQREERAVSDLKEPGYKLRSKGWRDIWASQLGISMQRGALHVPGDKVDHRGRKAAEVIGPGAGAESVR